MRKSTLMYTAMAFALCAGMLAPETAWAKKIKRTVAYDHDGWTLQGVVSQGGDYGGKHKAAYLPGGTSGSKGFSGFGDLNQLLAGACQLGGIGVTVAGFVTGGIGIIPGLVVSGICGAQQIAAWASPPPTFNVRIPDKYTTVFVPGPEQPAPYQYFLQPDTQPAEEMPREDVPVARNESAPTAQDPAMTVPKPVKAAPAKVPKPVPATPVPEKDPPKKGKGPEEVARAPLPGTILTPASAVRP